jgi:hypothetical protein
VPNIVQCPTGTHRVGQRCVPDIIVCPQGTRRVGNRCVPVAKPPTVQPTRPVRPIRPIRPQGGLR